MKNHKLIISPLEKNKSAIFLKKDKLKREVRIGWQNITVYYTAVK